VLGVSEWRLGIDFGTSFTVVAVARADHVEVADVESDGRARLPSTTFLTEEGEILVGTQAQHQAIFAPERYEPSPKRVIGDGEIFLGDRLVKVSDLIAGIFKRVYREVCRQQGESAPAAIQVTHPAEWAEARLGVLRSAIETAGLRNVTLVPEPVAAAARIAMESTQPGQCIAVYDFGGGTFDAAVLRRIEQDFEVVGPPVGRDPLGGEDIDTMILDHLGALLADDHPVKWGKLLNPPDLAWRQSATRLRSEVQRAKETLSEVMACSLWVDGIDLEVQLTRTELEKLARPGIDETVDILEQAIAGAHLEPQDLQGVYLVGGSSRIPLVADTIWRRLHVRPAVQDNPKSVVAMGAASWGLIERKPRGSDVVSSRLVTPAGGPTDKEAEHETSATPKAGVRGELGLRRRIRSPLVVVSGIVLLACLVAVAVLAFPSGRHKNPKSPSRSVGSTTVASHMTRAQAGEEYQAAITPVNSAEPPFRVVVQSWSGSTTNAQAQAAAASLVAALDTVDAQILSIAPSYPNAATALHADATAVTTLDGDLSQLAQLDEIGVSTWTQRYDSDLTALTMASNAARRALGLPAAS